MPLCTTNLLFDLPRTIHVTVVSGWLAAADVVRLDSSATSAQLRPQLLRLLADPSTILNNIPSPISFIDRELERRQIKWFQCRRAQPLFWSTNFGSGRGVRISNVRLLHVYMKKRKAENMRALRAIEAKCPHINSICYHGELMVDVLRALPRKECIETLNLALTGVDLVQKLAFIQEMTEFVNVRCVQFIQIEGWAVYIPIPGDYCRTRNHKLHTFGFGGFIVKLFQNGAVSSARITFTAKIGSMPAHICARVIEDVHKNRGVKWFKLIFTSDNIAFLSEVSMVLGALSRKIFKVHVNYYGKYVLFLML